MIRRSFNPVNRYFYDNGQCSYKNGWAQIDTRQDAWYYGIWTNPTLLHIVSYVEGDVMVEECSNETEYYQSLQHMANWYKENGDWLGIDAGVNPNMKQRFEALGLGELLH